MKNSSYQHEIICPLCKSINIKHLYVVNNYRIARCLSCSFIFVDHQLTINELQQAYEDDGIGCTYIESENIKNLEYYYLKLKNIILKYKKKYKDKDKDEDEEKVQRKILDIGCSTGQFLDVMNDWDCYGVELHKQSADLAQKKYGTHIHLGTLLSSPFEENFFDVITLQDVLDHDLNPLEMLKKCQQLLKPQGLIVIKVHNISCLYARLSGSKFYAVIPPFHLSYFNLKTLQLILEKSGFKYQQHQFIPQLITLKTIFLRLSRNQKKGLFYSIYKILDQYSIGKLTIKKNLHDIITIFAVKQ